MGSVMLTGKDLDEILSDYVAEVVPAMLRRGYHLKLAKGGPEYPNLPEQSLFTHIVNGVFALVQLLKFAVDQRVDIRRLKAENLRRALAMYTVHDFHKDPEAKRLEGSEFAIPLEQLEEEYKALGLEKFAGNLNSHLLRAANVHKRSPRQGDSMLSQDPDANFLWLLVRLADAMASAQTPEEALRSLSGYLPKLSPAFVPQSPYGKFQLYVHELQDVRGVLSNGIHQAVVLELGEKLGLFPLLYFATGTLYIGPAKTNTPAVEDLIRAVTERVLSPLHRRAGAEAISTAIREGQRRQKYDFERYVYALASVEDLLQVVYEDALAAKADPKEAIKEIEKLTEKRKELPADWQETIKERLGIDLSNPDKTFNELWARAYHYLLYVDTLLRDLNPGESRLEWLLRAFDVKLPYADNLRREAEIWAKGGVGKYVLVIAYHFLCGPDFADRKAKTFPPEEVLGRLHRRVLEAMRGIDTDAGRRAAEAELGLQPDLEAYLRENLRFSFAPATQIAGDGLADYIKPKRRVHTGKICSLCNRYSDYVQELRTGILDDFGRVFSNRVLPAKEAPDGPRLWCPVCHLEAILRKLLGMGLPPGGSYAGSRRIYLYVLPTYSFTPEHLRLFGPLLRNFHHVTNLLVRDHGEDLPGLPRLWLERRTLDPDWMNQVEEVLEREAERRGEALLGSKGPQNGVSPGSHQVGEHPQAQEVQVHQAQGLEVLLVQGEHADPPGAPHHGGVAGEGPGGHHPVDMGHQKDNKGTFYEGERILLGTVEREPIKKEAGEAKEDYSLKGDRPELLRVDPHYYLLVWEKVVREKAVREKASQRREKKGEKLVTRNEAWAKAIFAALILVGLTGCKVYVTERPYLPVVNPADLKATITLDGPPPALRALLGGRGDEVTLSGREKDGRSGLEQALDLSAALWVVTTSLRPGEDKHISARLGRVNVDPLAGAYFYKEYGRENDGKSSGSLFEIACEVLLEAQGGELKVLAEKIAQKCLDIALPTIKYGRGKAHRYELIFREAVSVLRWGLRETPNFPSEEAIRELKYFVVSILYKRLDSRRQSRRGDILIKPFKQEDLRRLLEELVNILVDELYLGRAGGSLARFRQLENAIASVIYYYTDKNFDSLWNNYRQLREEYKQQKDQKADSLTTEEV
ncbi:MAG: type I-D CRISPR-associated protein Cas10d/Csc3 [Thermus sp.]|uniref:type I-D CRISPR-associated protein Cas10d/Csc3 n=1 Tax=Thermus sp. TaxID=275 RepID=UPI00391D3E3F